MRTVLAVVPACMRPSLQYQMSHAIHRCAWQSLPNHRRTSERLVASSLAAAAAVATAATAGGFAAALVEVVEVVVVVVELARCEDAESDGARPEQASPGEEGAVHHETGHPARARVFAERARVEDPLRHEPYLRRREGDADDEDLERYP